MIDSSDVRKINVNLIRSVMWRGGEHTKQSVAMDTGLSVATCNTLLNELEKSGEILSEKRQLNGVGRSTSMYRINESYESMLCIRFDLLSDGSRALWCDVLSMLGTPVFQGCERYDRLDAALIVEKITETRAKFQNISCVLVGANGIVDNGVVRISDIPEMEGVHLLHRIREKVSGLPVHVAYDCQYRAYGAYKKAGYTRESLTLLFCMKNVLPGAASVINGMIINGRNGFAGMTGYMPYDVDREELVRLIAEEPAGISLIAKMVVSIITVLNSDEIVFAGNVIDAAAMEQVRRECETYLPVDFIPDFRVAEDGGDSYYLEGMYQKALEMKVDIGME